MTSLFAQIRESMPGRINDLLSEGLRDKHLPLSHQQGKEYNVLVSTDGQQFKSFATWNNEVRVQDFIDRQWLVQAPVLDTSGKHIVLHIKCALPFLHCSSIAGNENSVVYKATLAMGHQQGLTGDVAEVHVAVKDFRNEKSFFQEKENLQKIQQLHNQHIIELIATCQRGQQYYVIFPWAQGGNLIQFWESEDKRRNEELMLWSLCEMHNLVGALKALHRENCRHGDLKPENILHYKNKKSRLVIADVGVSKFHRVATSLRYEGTETRATTPPYEAPEAQPHITDARSRVYDMWSIGCIFLEFAVWLLYGVEAVEKFQESRASTDSKVANGSFYQHNSEGSAEIHPKVSEAMSILKLDPLCKSGTAIGDLIKVIDKDLLQVEVSLRAKAETLHNTLGQIVQEAKQNHGYFLNSFDSSPVIPPFFRRAGSRQNSWSAQKPEAN
ncbi:kinase-like protein [Hyaloscypha bicolor E]|uniref:Kinase-like protein n=1 Tax=Hyaloscypha bicolor E TaxID=1095630 RepID=A0A2J6SFY3_9HELO|nr:kinase-like protein [Hyaloscypha bicolor E]PMD49660.1 kinase-like protein [Hyaloscypha bicolor E]